MIILRKRPSLFWISNRTDLDQSEIFPAVPQNFLTQRKIIDSRTKRIQLYDSLDDAISIYSLGGKNLEGMILGVYRPRFLHSDNKLEPNISNCPYSFILRGKEYWSLLPLEMIKICEIKIGKKKGEMEFKASDRTRKQTFVGKNKLPIYDWEEIVPEWDKKGKTKKL